MQSVQVVTDTANQTLRLYVPNGVTGTVDVTVSVAEAGSSTTTTHTFHVTVAADTNNDNPFLGAIGTIRTTANTTTTVQIPATDVEGDAIYYDGEVSSDTDNLTLSMNQTTGVATITAKNNWAGVAAITVGVASASASSWDTQVVPVYVTPAKPTVALLASSDTGSSSSDGITNPALVSGTLGFRVSGVTSGAKVTLYCDGEKIGEATASDTSVIITSASTYSWTNGTHSITAKHALENQTVDVGNTSTTVTLTSEVSNAITVKVDKAAPQITTTAPTTAMVGQQYTYDVNSNEDPDVTYDLTTSPAGMLVNATSGVITWTPGTNQAATVSVSVRASDVAGNTATQSYQITVTRVNYAPVANAQSVRLTADTSKAIVLTGDDGNEGVDQVLTYTVATQPSHGTLSGLNAATGAVTYTPDAGYTGTDSFTFTVTDDDTAGDPASLTSPAATVSIKVVPVNHAPTADPQSVTTDEDEAITITLTGDDGDPGFQQTISFLIVDQPSHGMVTVVNANAGTVIYTPTEGYNGTDTFTFKVMDDDTGDPSFLTSDPATVSITINAVEDPPAAHDETVLILENTSWDDALPGDDGDPMPNEVQQILFTITAGPSHGEITSFDSSTGAIVYTPDANYNGSDAITFTVKEVASGLVTDPATVTINITAVNVEPIAADQEVTTAEDTALTVSLGSDGDPEVEQTLTLNVVTAPAHGKLSGFDTKTGNVIYTPDADFNGTDSFTYTLSDDDTAGLPEGLYSPQATVTVQVTPVDDPPRFAAIQPGTAIPGEVFRTTVVAADPDSPAASIRYSLEPGAPDGAAIDPVSGQITWSVPILFPAGPVRMTVRATELTDAALSATRSFDVTVSDFSVLSALASSPQSSAANLFASAVPVPTLVPPSAQIGDPATDPAHRAIPVLMSRFGGSDLLNSQAFFAYPFGPFANGGSAASSTETQPSGLEPRGPAQDNPAQGDSGGEIESLPPGIRIPKRSDNPTDRSLPQKQSSVGAPELKDVVMEEAAEDGEWFDAADVVDDPEVLLAVAG